MDMRFRLRDFVSLILNPVDRSLSRLLLSLAFRFGFRLEDLGGSAAPLDVEISLGVFGIIGRRCGRGWIDVFDPESAILVLRKDNTWKETTNIGRIGGSEQTCCWTTR